MSKRRLVLSLILPRNLGVRYSGGCSDRRVDKCCWRGRAASPFLTVLLATVVVHARWLSPLRAVVFPRQARVKGKSRQDYVR
jgi:hypothetical protein